MLSPKRISRFKCYKSKHENLEACYQDISGEKTHNAKIVLALAVTLAVIFACYLNSSRQKLWIIILSFEKT